MPEISKEDRDLMYRLLDGNESAAMPFYFRKKHGVALEIMLASAQALLLVNETLSVVRVIHEGLDVLALPAAKGNRTLVGQQVRQSEAATSLLAGHRHPLHSIVIVNLTTALESGIEDTVIVALRFVPQFVQTLCELGIDCEKHTEDRDLSYEEARELYAKLEAWKKRAIKRAVPEKRNPPFGWLLMLDAIGLPVSLSEPDCAALREMIYVRNSIVHRAGRADARAATEMRNPVEPNRLIHITQEDMSTFATASLALASGIVAAVATRDATLMAQP